MAKIEEEKLPISDFYKVIDYVTIFKSEKWWEAIVISESYGKRQIGMYLWQKRENERESEDQQKGEKAQHKWKRKHKFNVRDLAEWNKLKNAIEQLAPKLAT